MDEILKAQMEAAEKRWLGGWKLGPQRTRWTSTPLQVGDAAPSFTFPDATGRMLALDSFWKDRPALLLFWRHFGCSCGIDRSRRLREEHPHYLALGANVVIIGQGEPERATAYAVRYDLPPTPILCDTEARAFEAYGLLEGRPSQILFDAPEALLDRDLQAGLDFMASRREEGRPLVDSPWLLPGEFVIDTAGKVVLAYRYNYCEDFPDPRVLYAALRHAGKEDPHPNPSPARRERGEG
jgi:peroxiredoxin